jgi:hypothetical protein
MDNQMPKIPNIRPNTPFVHLAVLLSLALGLGAFLIANATMIASDGTLFIEYAQKLQAHPTSTMQTDLQHPGYPCLISLVHSIASLFADATSLKSWTLSAQFASLACKLVATVFLYLIARRLVGPQSAFWSILILTILPWPTQYGSDALTDWPHLLFLLAGFWLLLYGASHPNLWPFPLAGLAAAAGYLVRPESGQIVIYASAWLTLNLIRPQRILSRRKSLTALALLLAAFAILTIPYMSLTGFVLPEHQLVPLPRSLKISPLNTNAPDQRTLYLAALPLSKIANGLWKLLNNLCETLMYYFVPALFIGLFYQLRKKPRDTDTFYVTAFILFNVIVLLWLFNRAGYISKRHSLPMIIITALYIPVGMNILSTWLSRITPKRLPKMIAAPHFWFISMFLVGLAICTPKLLRPPHADKKPFLLAANWLKQNAKPNDLVWSFDTRIPFYAEVPYARHSSHPGINCLVHESSRALWLLDDPAFQPVHSIPLDKDTTLIIYRKKT